MSPSKDRMTAVLPVVLVALLALVIAPAGTIPSAQAAEGVAWRLEQPMPPQPPVGVPPASTPIGLGSVGDIEFWAPNRAVLITQGNGSTIPPGLWAYDGAGWHELATVCGATDGRITWAGPDEFWTISDGRPGQAADPKTGRPAPVEDNTLCHFARGEVAVSYGAPAFQANSYQAMHALGCISPTDCWFAGDPLPAPEAGEAFHLHWNGGSLTAEPNPHGHSVQDMREFEGRLLESVRLSTGDLASEFETLPSALHAINPVGVSPQFEPILGVPAYSAGEFPEAIEYLRLGADGEALWAAAGAAREPPEHSTVAAVTVERYAAGQWSHVLGPERPAPSAIGDDVVNSIAPEPGTGGAWMALDSQDDAQKPSPTASATIAHVDSAGTVETQTLPSAAETAEGIGPKGAAKRIACPSFQNCWLVTNQGWLFHLAPEGERTQPLDATSAFPSLITFRPPDEGVPKIVPDAPPPDTSGVVDTQAAKAALTESLGATEAKVRSSLLSNIHSRLVRGTTLELRFHLAVKARVRLLAKRKKKVVASTATRTFASGNRKLLLTLDRRRWPTKLNLKTKALAPLPLVSTRTPGTNTVGTAVVTLPGVPAFGGSPSLLAPFRGKLP